MFICRANEGVAAAWLDQSNVLAPKAKKANSKLRFLKHVIANMIFLLKFKKPFPGIRFASRDRRLIGQREQQICGRNFAQE
jgi:hypothetical protein